MLVERGKSWSIDKNMSTFQFSYLGTHRRAWFCKTTYYIGIGASERLAGGPVQPALLPYVFRISCTIINFHSAKMNN